MPQDPDIVAAELRRRDSLMMWRAIVLFCALQFIILLVLGAIWLLGFTYDRPIVRPPWWLRTFIWIGATLVVNLAGYYALSITGFLAPNQKEPS